MPVLGLNVAIPRAPSAPTYRSGEMAKIRLS
jgi:hypothetical protein